MSKPTEKYSKRGIRNSNISTVIGISLVLFMIGIVLGGVLGLQDIQKQAKESLHGDVFFQPSLNESDIKSIEAKLKSWPEFKSIFYVSPDAAIDIFEGQSENEDEIDFLIIFYPSLLISFLLFPFFQHPSFTSFLLIFCIHSSLQS